MNRIMTLWHPRVWKTSLAGVLVAGVGFFLIDRAVNFLREELLPKNVAVVREGVLYRSGQLKPSHFDDVLRRYRIRTVVQLNPSEENEWEETHARQIGADLVRVAMPGTGWGETADFDRVLKLIRDPARQPVLVHCAAGANRTGMVSALFRMMDEGWTHADAVREMESKGFDRRVNLPKLLEDVQEVLVDREQGKGRH
jgi:protein tyrosine/serine phosphatase